MVNRSSACPRVTSDDVMDRCCIVQSPVYVYVEAGESEGTGGDAAADGALPLAESEGYIS